MDRCLFLRSQYVCGLPQMGERMNFIEAWKNSQFGEYLVNMENGDICFYNNGAIETIMSVLTRDAMLSDKWKVMSTRTKSYFMQIIDSDGNKKLAKVYAESEEEAEKKFKRFIEVQSIKAEVELID